MPLFTLLWLLNYAKTSLTILLNKIWNFEVRKNSKWLTNKFQKLKISLICKKKFFLLSKIFSSIFKTKLITVCYQNTALKIPSNLLKLSHLNTLTQSIPISLYNNRIQEFKVHRNKVAIESKFIKEFFDNETCFDKSSVTFSFIFV